MGLIDNLLKIGSYLNGREDGLRDRPRRIRKPSNRDEYMKGYKDALRLREVKALERLASMGERDED